MKKSLGKSLDNMVTFRVCSGMKKSKVKMVKKLPLLSFAMETMMMIVNMAQNALSRQLKSCMDKHLMDTFYMSEKLLRRNRERLRRKRT